jgi:hypothetical protein
MQSAVAMFYAIVGCTLIGVGVGSWMVGVGAYCCIVAIGNWN